MKNPEIKKLTMLQEGVTFYLVNSYYDAMIVDVDIDDDVHELHFNSDISADDADGIKVRNNCVTKYNLTDMEKVFPQIETLVISGSIKDIFLNNKSFPNVKKVISNSCRFKSYESGALLASRYMNSGLYYLYNTFCKKDGEETDLTDISRICKGAFADCESANITHVDYVNAAVPGAFDGYKAIDKLPRIDDAVVVDHILVSCENHIPDSINHIYQGFDLSDHDIITSNLRAFNGYPENHMPRSLTIDDKGIIDIANIRRLTSNKKIKTMNINPDNPYLKSVDGIVYTADMSYLIACPAGKTGKVVIPDGVKTIGKKAFGNSDIDEVVIPDSVINVESNAFEGSALKRFTLGKGMEYIGMNMFTNCENLKNIEIPSHIKEIKDYAFYNLSCINEVIIPEGVEIIGSNAFRFDTFSEAEIVIPDSIKKLSESAFPNAKRYYVKTKNKRLPAGFFSAIRPSHVYDNNPIYNYIVVDGKEYMIPYFYFKAYGLDEFFKFYPFDEKVIWKIYESIDDKLVRLKFMISLYPTVEDKEIKKNIGKELRSLQRSIIKLLYVDDDSTDKDRELFIQYIGYNLCTKKALESVIKEADKNGDADIKAYVLKSLNDMEKPKTKGFKL